MNRTAAPEIERLSPEAEARANARVASMPFLQGAQITMPEELPAAGVGVETAAATETQPTPQRRQRSDAGRPRPERRKQAEQARYVDAPGVRFDVMHAEGRAAFTRWISLVYMDGGAIFGLKALEQLFAHIDRLSEGTRKPEAK